MDLASQDAELKAALFRFVDVVPACRSLDDLARHLTGFLGEVEQPTAAGRRRDEDGQHPSAGRAALGAAAAAGVRHMAHRFIVGESPRAALGVLRDLWKDGVASLGRPARRGDRHPGRGAALRRALRARRSTRSSAPRRGGPIGPQLERDSAGPLPRANLSVKVSALTPLLRPDAPERGKRDAADRLRRCCAGRGSSARTCTSTWSRWTRATRCSSWCSSCSPRTSSATARRAGMVLQAYLRDSPQTLDTILDWLGRVERAQPADRPARQGRLLGPRDRRGRSSTAGRRPVFEVKADCDRNFEALTRRLLDARPARPRGGRLPQPALGRARDRLQPADRRRRPGPRAPGPARPRRPAAGRDRAPGPARAHLLPGRRPRGRHGLPRAAPAREHRPTTRSWPTRRAGVAARGAARARREPDAVPPTSRPRAAPRRRARRSSPTRCAAHDARGAARACRCGSANERRDGRRRSSRPTRASPSASSRRRRRRRPDEVDAALDAARRGPRDWARRPAAERADELLARRRSGCASGGSRSPRSRCASARSRGRRPTPTCARRSTSSSTTRAGRVDARARARRCCRCPASATRCATPPRGVVAVISPWNFPRRDPARDDRRRAWRPATPSSSSRPSSRPAAR